MEKRVCSLCGKTFDFWDEKQKFVLEHRVGYGSIYDGEYIRETLCCECLDELIEFLHNKRERLNGR